MLGLAGVMVAALTGCGATMRPISSTPPVPTIVLRSSYNARGVAGILPPVPFHVILPPGEYRPLYEDDQAYYYQAPSKLVVNDLTSLLYDGGIYVQRGTSRPTGWYYIGEDGTQQWGKFDGPLPTK
jgi:hypothetical protein